MIRFWLGITEKTQKLWKTVVNLYEEERKKGGILDADTKTPSDINAYPARIYK